MEIEPLTLSHQKLLEDKFSKLNAFLSEYSFANLYLFRHLHDYKIIKHDGEVFIKGITRDQIPFFMPTTDLSQVSFSLLESILESMFAHANMLFPIPEEWISALKDKGFHMDFKEADSDYLFSTSKLLSFPGRHLSSKRNAITQLTNNHVIKSKTLDKESFNDALHILNAWQNEKNVDASDTDYASCQEAIHYFELLHLHGRIIYVDDKPTGFIIGEWLTKDCYTAHFSKALNSVIGIYSYLYQDLAHFLDPNFSWINLEQDLGIPSLQKTKHSYLPDQLLRKWRIFNKINSRMP